MAKTICNLLQPLNVLEPENTDKCIIVILNMPLLPNIDLLKVIWNKSIFKLSVDGGTNELYNHLAKESDIFNPDCITGDLDSIESEVMEHFVNTNVEIISTPDQNSTDFSKALEILKQKIDTDNIDAKSIIVLGAFGGRLDQVLANIDSLFHCRFDIPVYLMSNSNLAVLLRKGSHKIRVQSAYRGAWCGLVPIGVPCTRVTTSGLKWNLNNQTLKFGELISTSNSLEATETEFVAIETDNSLLWIMGYSV